MFGEWSSLRPRIDLTIAYSMLTYPTVIEVNFTRRNFFENFRSLSYKVEFDFFTSDFFDLRRSVVFRFFFLIPFFNLDTDSSITCMLFK